MNERLCMLYEEDCRTAVFGKTERTVGWEGDGGFCDWVPAMESNRSSSHPFTLDIVVHCRTRKQLDWVRVHIERRLARCKLELNAEKTRVVYCKDSNRTEPCDCYRFDFLGYTFRPRSARDRAGNFFVSFSPAISPKASKTLRQKVRRDWRLVSRVFMSLNGLARWLNPKIAGWIQYYGRFCRSTLHSVLNHINHALEAWAMRKFKRLRGRKHRSRAWLRAVARRSPNLFVHWQYQGWMTRAV